MDKTQIIYGILAILIWIAGYFHNGRFVRPKWKIPGKFVFYAGVSILLIYFFKHYSLIFIIGHPLIGLITHTYVCVKFEINWITCRPAERYLELTEKWARGDFSSNLKKND